MRTILGIVLVVGLISTWAHAADRKEELFTAWETAQRDVKSLVVEFTEETLDPVFRSVDKAKGTFRLLRTPKGDFVATYEMIGEGKVEPRQVWTGLLNDRKIYVLWPNKKEAIQLDPTDGDLLGFLQDYLNPLVVLLDQKRAKATCHLEVTSQEDWYTYLMVKPKEVKTPGWGYQSFELGRVVLANKDHKDIPKNMPCQLWFSVGNCGKREVTFKITKWLLNAPDAPKMEEFTKPEERPGWTVHDMKSLSSQNFFFKSAVAKPVTGQTGKSPEESNTKR